MSGFVLLGGGVVKRRNPVILLHVFKDCLCFAPTAGAETEPT